MKNLVIVSLLFVLLFVCALSGAAQRKQQPGTKPSTKPVMTGQPQQTATPPTAGAAKPANEQAGVIQGKVIDLGWGDSLTVLDAQGKQHRVRLLGIDAPEKEQAFGPAARQKLSALVFGKPVVVKYQKIDRSGRPLGKVTVGALDVNLEMLKTGMAWYYPNDRDLPESDRPLYAGAEREARAAPRGLWQDEAPVSPWEFRQIRRQQTVSTPNPNSDGTSEQVMASSDPEPAPPERAPNPLNEKTIAPVKESDAPPDQAEASTSFPRAPKVSVTGDASTRTYYKAGCPEGDRVSPQNRVSFGSVEEAEKAGYRRTPNCP
jgi:endonuclease YncB( thermonuclease family)